MSLRNTAAAVTVAVLAALGILAGGASSSTISYHNPVLDNFNFGCNDTGLMVGSTATTCLSLINQSALFYPQKYIKTGMTIRVTLYLPKGTRLSKSLIRMAASPGWILRFKRAPSDFRYTMVKDKAGISRPVWVFHHSIQGEPAYWKFTVGTSSSTTKMCLGAVAVAVGVTGAPVQKAQRCFGHEE
jgi:hypothetical protein